MRNSFGFAFPQTGLCSESNTGKEPSVLRQEKLSLFLISNVKGTSPIWYSRYNRAHDYTSFAGLAGLQRTAICCWLCRLQHVWPRTDVPSHKVTDNPASAADWKGILGRGKKTTAEFDFVLLHNPSHKIVLVPGSSECFASSLNYHPQSSDCLAGNNWYLKRTWLTLHHLCAERSVALCLHTFSPKWKGKRGKYGHLRTVWGVMCWVEATQESTWTKINDHHYLVSISKSFIMKNLS